MSGASVAIVADSSRFVTFRQRSVPDDDVNFYPTNWTLRQCIENKSYNLSSSTETLAYVHFMGLHIVELK